MNPEQPGIIAVTVNPIPQLTIHTKAGIQHLSLASKTTWTFGRNKDNAVPLKDPWASRYHAQIEVIQGQHCYLADLNSRNGTLLNEHTVTMPILLQHDDRICIGDTVFHFEYASDKTPALFAPPQSKPVLMLQQSTIQGGIWQNVLQARDIPVVWETSDTNFKKQIELSAVSKALPKILLTDVRAYQGNAYHFCRWCNEKFPGLKVFLMDSWRSQISDFERRVAVKNGAVNLLSALDERHLNPIELLLQINEVLVALGNRTISIDELLTTLKMLEHSTVVHES
jgi:pSer/pThr/pTyr-binding forkhead associated (FHA) protein